MNARTLSFALALAALVGLPWPAAAQSIPKQATPVIAVIDPLSVANVIDQPELRIIGRAKAAQSLEPQFEKAKKSFQDEINKERDKLQAEGKKLASQRAVLSPEAYAQREQELRQRLSELQTLYLRRRDQLVRSATLAVGKIRKAMMEAVLDVAKERAINLVLPREIVLAAANSLDITDEVVKRVDKKMPTLKFELVKPAPEPPKGPEPAARAPGQSLPRGLQIPTGPQ
jgi:outer membrane protein